MITTSPAPAVLAHTGAVLLADEFSHALALPPPPNPAADYGPASPRWHEQSLSKGAAGVAVLHGVRARHHDLPCHVASVHAWLARATRDDLNGGVGAGLWFGAPAVAFALSVAAPDRYAQTAARLRTAVADLTHRRLVAAHARINAAARPALGEFDLVRGLSGLGAYLLRTDPHGDLLHRVIAYLVRLTAPVPAEDPAGTHVPGWWTSDIPRGEQDRTWVAGHANLGMAHGIAGPLALLALAMRSGITVPGHADAIDTITGWLDTWRQDGPAGPWWPERLTLAEHDSAQLHQHGPARPSWCYGTPGLARAQQLAALARRDTARQDAAEHAFLACVRDSAQLARLANTTICHGWAGLALTTWCVAADARTPDVAAQLPALTGTLTRRARDTTATTSRGLVEGPAGVALTLHHISAGASAPTDWLACLLLA